MKTSTKEMLSSYKGIKNSHEIEGLYLTEQDESFFQTMIVNGLNVEERKAAIDLYLAKKKQSAKQHKVASNG